MIEPIWYARPNMYVRRLLCGAALLSGAVQAESPSFDCMIEPLQVIEIRSPVVGLISSIHVHRGDTVKKGSLLVSIDSRVESSSADAARAKAEAVGAQRLAEAKLAAAKIKAKRNQELYDDDFVSAQARDEAEAERSLAEAEVQSASENLSVARLEFKEAVEQVRRREIHSPVAGVVMDQYLYAGSLVDSSEGKKPILKLAQINVLKVESVLPFSFYRKIKAGTQARIIPEEPLTGSYTGVVKVIDRVIDSASGTFGVVVELENPAQNIPAGVRCKASFMTTD